MIPEKSWLEHQWYLPPKGLGKSDQQIADELNVSYMTVANWRKKYEISEPANLRNVYHRTGNGISRKPIPEKEWLKSQYLKEPNGLGKTLDEIAAECEVARDTVRRWLEIYGISEDHSYRHSKRMSGEGNPAYKSGASRTYHKHTLQQVSKPVCEWCGSRERVQVHHRDHDITNGELSNLGWLCQHCNLIEAHLYGLIEKGHATAIIEPRKRIVIKFK